MAHEAYQSISWYLSISHIHRFKPVITTHLEIVTVQVGASPSQERVKNDVGSIFIGLDHVELERSGRLVHLLHPSKIVFVKNSENGFSLLVEAKSIQNAFAPAAGIEHLFWLESGG